MADLSKLFVLKPQNLVQFEIPKQNVFQANTYNLKSRNLFGYKSQNAESSQITPGLRTTGLFVPALRKTQKQLAKTTIENVNMLQEIQYYKKLTQKQFFQKAFFTVALPLFILAFFGLLNHRISFQLILIGVSLLLIDYFPIQTRSLRTFINLLPIITYLALFYDILTLKNLTGEFYGFLSNIPALIVSMIAAFNFFLFQKIQFLSQKNIRNTQINLHSWQTCKYFLKKFGYKLQNILKAAGFIFFLNTALALCLVIYLLCSGNWNLFSKVFFETNIFGVLLTYWVLYLYIHTIDFIGKQISFFTLKQKFYQVHVFMSLLRLKPSKNDNQLNNEKIQQRCLFELAKQLKANNFYLETPVNVNYAIKTYRDIFQIYAQNQLIELDVKLNETYLKIVKNKKIIESTKEWRQDLFIYVKKFIAQVQNDLMILQMVSEVENKKILLLILVKLSADSPLKTKIIDTLNDIIKTLSRTEKNTVKRLRIGQRKLLEWENQLNLLVGSMRNQKSGVVLNRISQADTKGWCHYQRKTLLKTD